MNSSRSWRNCRFRLRLLLLNELDKVLRGRILDAPNTNRCPATTGRRLESGLLVLVVEVVDSSSLRLRICAESNVLLVDACGATTTSAVSLSC